MQFAMPELASRVGPLKGRLAAARCWALRSSWLRHVARLGYASKGLVYMLVGVLAVQAAFGARRQTTGVRVALYTIVRQPFGSVLLGMVALGLGLHVVWRLLQAGVDPERKGTKLIGLAHRAAYVGSAVIFANLVWDAVEVVVGWGRGDVDVAEDWTRLVLAQPLGRWLVALAGLIMIGFGLYELYEAYTARFRRKFRLDEMSVVATLWVTRIGRFGLAARGIVFGIVGSFLIVAALRTDAEQARGLGEALAGLAGGAFGPWLLAVIALGLVAYGIYMLAEARYRWIVRPCSET